MAEKTTGFPLTKYFHRKKQGQCTLIETQIKMKYNEIFIIALNVA